MKNPKNDTTKLIYKTETYSQCWIMNLWLPQGEKWEVRNILVFRDWHVHTAILKIDNQKDSSCITLKNCCCSVAKSCLILCDCKDSSMSGFPVLHHLLELTQTHVHWVGDAIQPSHLLSSLSLPAFSLSQHQGLFQWVSSSYQVAKVLEFQLQHQSFQWTFRTDFP